MGRAFARAGLLGNPSDVYEGKTLAVSVRNFAAVVSLEEADRFEFVPGPAEAMDAPSFGEMLDRIDEQGCHDGVRLLRATIRRFALARPELASLPASDPRTRFRLHYHTEIPRQVGLSGSSAIAIAALRALASWFGTRFEPLELSEVALAVEAEELGLTAGPMDRVIQAYEGAVHMDFGGPRCAASYTRLDPAVLPPLFVVWDPRVGDPSDRVHGDVRLRWLRGDPDVRAAMQVFPQIVDDGMECLARGDHAGFRRCMDRNFDTRASIWKLSRRDLEMIRIGRETGAAVKLCGSGGAIVGALAKADDFPVIREAYATAGYSAIRPVIVPDEAGA
jgi:glucuronokinase